MGNIIECNSLTVRHKAPQLFTILRFLFRRANGSVIGPDGVGKSTLLSLIAGERVMQKGQLQVLGGDMRDEKHRAAICSDIAYMPQGLKNISHAVCRESLQFFAKLLGTIVLSVVRE